MRNDGAETVAEALVSLFLSYASGQARLVHSLRVPLLVVQYAIVAQSPRDIEATTEIEESCQRETGHKSIVNSEEESHGLAAELCCMISSALHRGPATCMQI